MTKKTIEKNVKKDNPEQSRRFVETANNCGSDQSGKSFDRAIKSIKPSKKN